MSNSIPKWHRELEIFRKVKPIMIIEGNVLDSYRYPLEGGSIDQGSVVPQLTDYLFYYFKDVGYESIVYFNNQFGFSTNINHDDHLDIFADVTGDKVKGKNINFVAAAPIVYKGITQTKKPVAVVLDFASRYIVSAESVQPPDVDSFTILIQASLAAMEINKLKNMIVVVVNKVNDLPTWFYLQNPNVKLITLDPPQKEEREAFIKGDGFRWFFDQEIYNEDIVKYEGNDNELAKIQDRLVSMTDGLSFTEINNLRILSQNEKMRVPAITDVIDLFKYGIKENPWNKLSVESLKTAHDDFTKRVKGQDLAITKTLDVIKRAVTGLSGLQSSSISRPKGVLFFAGPTGTGKTETAKTLAEILFGDERACIRFDMSEYGQGHSDQKLLGAPPGYVGYEAGGQLTNAVKKNPFAILLFDEIEKAHPSIFDKFLQILEDGRMTDGQGNTVYFSEAVIIFTSNLGIYSHDRDGVRSANVTTDMEYPDVQAKVKEAIEDYFKLDLGRPELLNRIGENIVVFDFIRDDVAELILDSQIEKIIERVAVEKNIKLSLQEAARQTLLAAALGNLSNGGRGIGNIVENMLINPLARYLFDQGIFKDSIVVIQRIESVDQTCSLVCMST